MKEGKRKKWLNEEIDYVIMHYANSYAKQIAEKLNCELCQVYRLANKLKLKKSEEFKAVEKERSIKALLDTGKRFRFKKGIVPKNKGIKLDPNSDLYKKMSKTMFKKGLVPHNYKPVGTETIRDGYTYIKVSEKKWELKHVFLFKSNIGEIPKGYNVIFKDKNKENFELSNLLLISDAELMALNTIHNYPEELKSTMKLLKKLNRKINEKQAI